MTSRILYKRALITDVILTGTVQVDNLLPISEEVQVGRPSEVRRIDEAFTRVTERNLPIYRKEVGRRGSGPTY